MNNEKENLKIMIDESPEKELDSPGKNSSGDESDLRKAPLNNDEKSSASDSDESEGKEESHPVADSSDRKIFIIRIAAVVLAVLGMIMLVSGMVLHRLDEESRKTPEKAQMPEEYIEEFFSDQNEVHDIENYIEQEG